MDKRRIARLLIGLMIIGFAFNVPSAVARLSGGGDMADFGDFSVFGFGSGLPDFDYGSSGLGWPGAVSAILGVLSYGGCAQTS
ncbi:MAG: hypothetical protein QGM45_11970 [Anaerolineales bacterium]|nr:hypothetical protein [Anaerolineales bacterium]